MDGTERKPVSGKLDLSDVRGLARNEIENLVAAGLLEADLAAEIQSEDIQKKEDQQQSVAIQRLDAHKKQDEQDKDKKWLERMSLSYQEAFRDLMGTFDDAENKYQTIKSRAENLKDRLREKIERFSQSGIAMPGGEVAFYDRRTQSFVDGKTLQALTDENSKLAAEKFPLFTRQQQNANAAYVDGIHAYFEADDISQSAIVGGAALEKKKEGLKNSDGTISEEELKRARTDVTDQVRHLASRLQNAENADALLDASLADDPDLPTAENSQPKFISFAAGLKVSDNGNDAGEAARRLHLMPLPALLRAVRPS